MKPNDRPKHQQQKSQSAPKSTPKVDKQPRIIKLESSLRDSLQATFFIVANPGLEELVADEARELLGAQNLIPTLGGVQFDSTIGAVRLGQARLKIATRLLLRIDQFGARDFPKLFKKLRGLPWREWLKPGVQVRFRAASHASRLRIKKRIEEVAEEAVEDVLGKPTKETRELLGLIRVEDDLATASLDLSGELLHKRGEREDVGAAPLRETWAAAVLRRVSGFVVQENAERKADGLGDSIPWQWVEPMAGTAVFLREALSEGAPAEREFSLDTLLRVEQDGTHERSGNSSQLISKFSSAIVLDSSEEQLARAKEGLQSAKIKIHYGTRHEQALVAEKAARFVFVNPPWGHRLKGPDATDTADGQSRLLAKLESEWAPAFCAVILPVLRPVLGPNLGSRLDGSHKNGKVQIPKGWKELPPLAFKVGGVAVRAQFFVNSVRFS